MKREDLPRILADLRQRQTFEPSGPLPEGTSLASFRLIFEGQSTYLIIGELPDDEAKIAKNNAQQMAIIAQRAEPGSDRQQKARELFARNMVSYATSRVVAFGLPIDAYTRFLEEINLSTLVRMFALATRGNADALLNLTLRAMGEEIKPA